MSRVCVCVGWLSGRPPLSVDRGYLLVDSWWLAVDGWKLAVGNCCGNVLRPENHTGIGLHSVMLRVGIQGWGRCWFVDVVCL